MSWPAFHPGFLAYVSPWIPPNLGYYVTGGSWWMAIWSIFTYGTLSNMVLAQKLIYCAPLLASLAMYFFLRNHICKNHLVLLTGSISFAYTPEAVAESLSPIMWGYVLIPLSMNYLLNIINRPAPTAGHTNKNWIRDPLILAIVLELTASQTLGMQWLIFFLLATFAILLLKFLFYSEGKNYLKYILKNGAITITIFLAISWSVSWATYLFYTKNPDVPFVPPGINQFIINYSNMSIFNSIRLVGTGFNSYFSANILNLIFPLVAFSSLLMLKVTKKPVLIFTSAIVCIIGLTFGLLAQNGALDTLLNFLPLLSAFRGPEKVILSLSFFYSVLISISLYELISWLNSKYSITHSKQVIKRIFNARFKSGHIIGVALASLLVIATFSYIAMPSNPRFQNAGFSEIPKSYSQAMNVLESDSIEDYRYLPIPYTILTGNTLASAYQNYFFSNLGTGYSSTQSYIQFVSDALTMNQTTNLGALLAPGNTKYVFVLRDAVELGSSQWMVQGSPRIDNGYLLGDPDQYVPLLNQQTDLQLVGNTDDLLTYQNLDFMPHIAVTSSLTYVVGDRTSLLALSSMPGYQINSSVNFFGEMQPSLELLQASSDVVFYERDMSDLSLSFLVSDYGRSLSKYAQSMDVTWVANLPNWTKSSPISRYLDIYLHDGSFFTYSDSYAETTGVATLSVPFTENSDDLYDLWIRVLQSPNSNGTLNFELNGSPLNITTPTHSNIFKGFTWVNLGKYDLVAGENLLSIKNNGGFSAIDTFLAVPSAKASEKYQLVNSLLENKRIMLVYSSLDEQAAINASASMSNIALSKFTINNVTNQTNGLSILTNAPSIDKLFIYNSIMADYTYTTTGPNQYQVTLSGAPSFIILADSFHNSWIASSSNGSLLHFPAYSLTNGFYLNDSSKTTVTIQFKEGSFTRPEVSGIKIAVLSIVLCLIICTLIPKNKIKQLRNRAFQGRKIIR